MRVEQGLDSGLRFVTRTATVREQGDPYPLTVLTLKSK